MKYLDTPGVCKPSQIRKYFISEICEFDLREVTIFFLNQNCGYNRANSSENVRISIANLRIFWGVCTPLHAEPTILLFKVEHFVKQSQK